MMNPPQENHPIARQAKCLQAVQVLKLLVISVASDLFNQVFGPLDSQPLIITSPCLVSHPVFHPVIPQVNQAAGQLCSLQVGLLVFHQVIPLVNQAASRLCSLQGSLATILQFSLLGSSLLQQSSPPMV